MIFIGIFLQKKVVTFPNNSFPQNNPSIQGLESWDQFFLKEEREDEIYDKRKRNNVRYIF
jgi:hypothetical protein